MPTATGRPMSEDQKRDLDELARMLKACKDPDERKEIRQTIEEVSGRRPIKLSWAPPVRRPTGLELWKRRFAARLAEAMGRKRATLTGLSFATGLPYDHLKRVSEAKVYPSHLARSKMAKALGTTLKFLES